MTDEFIGAVLGQPFGLKGFIRLHSLSGEDEHIRALKTVHLRLKNKTVGVEKIFEIEDFSGSGGNFAVKLKGIDSPEAAVALNRAELLLSREDAAPLKEGEYYIEDVKGCSLVTKDGSFAGTVLDIVEGGNGFLLEYENQAKERIFLPFRNEFVGAVDIVKRTVELL
ncbi:MAG: ribosome maturation factor RimM [Spirochaetaceae bacterium]|nr:ribosome maturation factor RimM [Spirochaetaceae bacterium]